VGATPAQMRHPTFGIPRKTGMAMAEIRHGSRRGSVGVPRRARPFCRPCRKGARRQHDAQ
jgi:hypothetical protein